MQHSVRPRRATHITKNDLIAVERPPIHPTAVYDVTDAAAHVALHPETLRLEIRAGRLACSQIGTTPRLTGQQILDWLKSLEKKPAEHADASH